GVGVTSWLAFGVDTQSAVRATALVYAPLPFLLWAAVRFGQRGAASMLFIVACFAIWSTAHGHGVFMTRSISESVLGVQLFLCIVGVPVLALATLSEERQHFSENLRLNEERYRAVVESQTELVCRYKADTTLTFANEAYCRFFGKKREELLGRSFLVLIPEESHPAVLQTTREMIETKQGTTLEHQVLRPDGSIGWMQWDDYPTYNEQGELQELQGIGRDITDRRQAQEALRQSEEKFAGAFHASPNAISINRVKDDQFVDVNERWEDLFRISHGDAIGRTATELGICTSAAEHERIRMAIEGGIALRNQELQLHRGDGTPCWVSVSCELINPGGEPCYLGIIQDITERKRVDEAWQSVAHATRLALIGELTASIAHEINQPLGAILSNAEAAEMMLNQPTPPLDQVRAILSDIRKDDLRASEVIKGVRALVSKRKHEAHPLDLQVIVGEVLSLIRPDALRRGVKLVSEIAETPPGLLGDRIQMQQVMLNLILNGMDAMNTTAAENRCLRIRSSNDSGRTVEVSVADTGHGIPPERLPRIFDSFFTTKEHGMGLGLAMVRSIIELHRGHVTAENNSEGGATFRFRLPIDTVSEGSPKP
ncbi:MAG: PAS domain S-box protein, partial [Chthoniobacter sp.]